MAEQLQLSALCRLPEILADDDLSALLDEAVVAEGLSLRDGDILVVAQKIISKAERRDVFLDEVKPSAEALLWSKRVNKDARLVQLILDESVEVVRHRPGVMIVEHRCGYIHANAGIDRSNISVVDGRERVLLLPLDANRSAAELRCDFSQRGVDVGVIVSDSAGRAWRNGITGFAIGSAGVPALRSCVGQRDLYGRELEVTEMADADELASAASLLMGQGDESVPAVLVRGWSWCASEQTAAVLIREKSVDLFR